MDSPNSIRNSTSFKAKKWTLFSFCAIGIVVTIIMAAQASKLVDTYVENYSSDLTEEQKESVKQNMIVLIWIISVFTILINVMGLVGAYKEHYCMTVTYAVLMTIGALGSISTASKNPYYWSTTILSMITCVVTYAYAYDLRKTPFQTFATPIIVTTGQNTGFVHVYQTTGQPYVVGPQLNGQYGQPYVAGPQFSGQYGQPNAGQVIIPYPPPGYTSSEQKTNY